ncbi:MAG: hypothetical protein WBM07_10975 [Chitinivibrionales bacterium]
MLESPIQNKIMLALGGRPDVRIFRNNVGNGFFGKAFEESGRCITLIDYRRVQFGLAVGSSDLIGFKSVTITPDMVGRRVAVFLSPEVKKPGATGKTHQKDWRDMVNGFGGISGIVKSVEEAQELVGEPGRLTGGIC